MIAERVKQRRLMTVKKTKPYFHFEFNGGTYYFNHRDVVSPYRSDFRTRMKQVRAILDWHKRLHTKVDEALRYFDCGLGNVDDYMGAINDGIF